MKIEGEARYVDSRGKTHSIEGIGSLADDVNLQSLKVEGNIEFDEISCGKVKIEGSGEGNSLTAKSLSVEGSLEVDTLKVEEALEISGTIEVGSVDADEIEIESRAGKIDAVKCRKIKIFHDDGDEISGKFLRNVLDEFDVKVTRHKLRSRVRIKSIDAEKVDLQNCEVDVIRCTDAKIGTDCAVERLIVSGECKVADDSKVGEIIKEDEEK